MKKKYPIDLDHDRILEYINTRSYVYFLWQLGKETEENSVAYQANIREAKELIHGKRDCLLPKGWIVISDEWGKEAEGIEKDNYLARFTIALSCKEYITESQTEAFIFHLLQVSYLNAVRDYVRITLVPALYKQHFGGKPPYSTKFFGPGLYRMPIEAMEEMYQYMELEESMLKLHNGILTPQMSFLGVVYITDKEVLTDFACESCSANIGCEYCMVWMDLEERGSGR